MKWGMVCEICYHRKSLFMTQAVHTDSILLLWPGYFNIIKCSPSGLENFTNLLNFEFAVPQCCQYDHASFYVFDLSWIRPYSKNETGASFPIYCNDTKWNLDKIQCKKGEK